MNTIFKKPVLLFFILFVPTSILFAQGNNTTLVGYFDTGGIANGVAVDGSYAYVADHYHGLRIIDISDPSNPGEIGAIDPQDTDRAWDVVVNGSYAYVAYGLSGLWIFNISNPTNPTLAGFFDTGGFATGVAVSGLYAFVADGLSGLRIINISDPSNPSETGFFDTGNLAAGVTIYGPYAYVADGSAGLRIIDISDPSNPGEKGFFDIMGGAKNVAVEGIYAYVAYGEAGLRIINISDPTNPIEVGYYDTADFANDVALDSNYVYVADDDDGLYIIKNDLLNEVKVVSNQTPMNFYLYNNYPNPFNPFTIIKFSVPKTSYVTLKVYTILGNEIATLVDEEITPGNYEVDFNASGLSSGVYFYKVESGAFTKVNKMLLLR